MALLKPTWLMLLGPALLLVGNAGCKSSAAKSASGSRSTLPVASVLHLEPFVVNLADAEANCFLRVGVDLGLGKPVSSEGKGEGDVPVARVRDCILDVLSTWYSAALLAPDGKQKLRVELVGALHARMPELQVKEVYFTDFLVQR